MEVTVSQMKQLEQSADAHGLSYTSMMENAGTAAAQALLTFVPAPLRTTAVFCGAGNNGGDGFVLARVLRQHGVNVLVILVDGEPKTADARLNWQRVLQQHIPVQSLNALTEENLNFIHTADAVVDAIYGTGFHGALRPTGIQAAAYINHAAGCKLALDLPSGMMADTGDIADGSVKADLTVTFHASKPCHRLASNFCGKLKIVSIGIENVL